MANLEPLVQASPHVLLMRHALLLAVMRWVFCLQESNLSCFHLRYSFGMTVTVPFRRLQRRHLRVMNKPGA